MLVCLPQGFEFWGGEDLGDDSGSMDWGAGVHPSDDDLHLGHVSVCFFLRSTHNGESTCSLT